MVKRVNDQSVILSLPKWLNFSANQGIYLKRVSHEIRVLHGAWVLLFVRNDR